jgi:hypothetical protein
MDGKSKSIFKPIKVNNFIILPVHSIYENYIPESKEVILENGKNIWIYENENISLPKKVSKDQIRFISRLITLFNDLQINKGNNLKFISSKNYISHNIVSLFLNFIKKLPNSENLLNSDPISATELFLSFSTLSFTNTFSLSYFITQYKIITDSKDEVLEENILNFFKFLSRKNIVVISKNLFGDTIIHPTLPTTKTSRNSGIFNESNYIIPTTKINIIDLSIIYLISSKFKIENNLVFGKISKIKSKKIQSQIPSININKLLKRISVSVEEF